MNTFPKNTLEEKRDQLEYQPKIFDLSVKADQEKVEELMAQNKIQLVVDEYEDQLKELFQVNNPSLIFSGDFEDKFLGYSKDLQKENSFVSVGKWVYYPWLFSLVHILEDNDFQKVRTARNKNLINEEEQQKFYHSTVGIAGLSVGNSVALAIVLQGGAQNIKIADNDILALSNMNRIRTGVSNLGLPKTIMTAREIYQINPYANIEIFFEGLTQKNIEVFFDSLDIVIDEIDNLAVKYLIREYAKKHSIAVVMAADNADSGVIDIERYDLDPQPEFFHGRMGEVSYDSLNALDKMGIGRMITRHIGPENVTERMQQSLLEIGKAIVSWPQLGGAALLNGSAVAYCVRKILNGELLENNRALISLDEKLIPTYNSLEEVKRREGIAENFKKMFKL